MFRILATICIATLLLSGCVSRTVPEPNQPNSHVVVTVKNSNVSFPAGSTFSWAEAASHFYENSQLDNSSIQTLLRNSIEQSLTSRGYRIIAQGGQFEIAYVAALSRDLTDHEINQRFGINPGMPDSSKVAYEKGTVLIDIDDPQTRRSLWRSALQVNVVFEMPEKERQQRIVQAVEKIFLTFPAEG